MTQKQKNCPHRDWKQVQCDEDDNPDGYNGYNYYKTIKCMTFVDISNSQYKCILCGLVFNYTGGNPHHVLEEESK